MVLSLSARDSGLVTRIATLIMFIGSAIMLLMVLPVWVTYTVDLGWHVPVIPPPNLLDRIADDCNGRTWPRIVIIYFFLFLGIRPLLSTNCFFNYFLDNSIKIIKEKES